MTTKVRKYCASFPCRNMGLPEEMKHDRTRKDTLRHARTQTRSDKKSMRLNVQQVIGLLRYTGKRLQEIDEQETAT